LRRLGSEDFNRFNELLAKGGSACPRWFVCREYELRKPPEADEDDHLAYYFLPKHEYNYFRDDDTWRSYDPLEDTPDLFLKFARLHERNDSIEHIVDWVHKYGVLGLDRPKLLHGEGGPKETLESFKMEVERAAQVLALYEAALSGDNEAALRVSEKVPWCFNDPFFKKESILNVVLYSATDEVTRKVCRSCHPALLVGMLGGPSSVQSVWTFDNLLGAMYLQMYWLMAAGGNVTRCRYCGRIISLASPQPGARKTRQDKKFCNDACRQRQYYHTKTKPKRQGKSGNQLR